MLKQSPSRKQRAKFLWVKRAVQMCLVLSFGIWIFNQLKLFLINRNSTGINLISSEMIEDIQKYMKKEEAKLNRKDLFHVSKDVQGDRNNRDVALERTEKITSSEGEEVKEERVDAWMEQLDYLTGLKMATENETSDGVHSAEDMTDRWASSLIKSDNLESFDSSVSTFDQDEKENNMELEFLEETARIEAANHEDASDKW